MANDAVIQEGVRRRALGQLVNDVPDVAGAQARRRETTRAAEIREVIMMGAIVNAGPIADRLTFSRAGHGQSTRAARPGRLGLTCPFGEVLSGAAFAA